MERQSDQIEEMVFDSWFERVRVAISILLTGKLEIAFDMAKEK